MITCVFQRQLLLSLLLIGLLPFTIVKALDTYDVFLEGEFSDELEELIEEGSELVLLQTSPPATLAGLRHRAEADIENIIQVLHSQAYYGARVTLSYDFERTPPVVIVDIDTGPAYPLADFMIIPTDCTERPFVSIDLKDLNLTIGDPALPETILNAEEELLGLLDTQGYPFASIKEREVIADLQQESITVKLHVDSGPPAYFGEAIVSGACNIQEAFFRKKLMWQVGELYNPCKIDSTHAALEATGLFSSISISHAEELSEEGQLPVYIDIIERKHRSIGWGITYNTQRGVGVTMEWEHRNIKGMGERVRFDTEVWKDTQDVRLLYVEPDYMRPRQDLLWLAEFEHEHTEGYTESSFRLSRTIERQLSEHFRFSYGGMYKWLQDTRSDQNRQYNLLKIPCFGRWWNTDSLLDPTRGHTLSLRLIPTVQVGSQPFAYCITTATGTAYCPITDDKRYVFATKLSFGSIWGSSRRMIPSSERFYEGCENSLRGYRYLTVSPLNHKHKPVGGRSLIVYTAEMRVRATESLGWVVFFDIGNVYEEIFPQLNQRLLQSIGYGIRYHTPVGPLRLDIAIPLMPRRHIDDRYQIYLSIGQAF